MAVSHGTRVWGLFLRSCYNSTAFVDNDNRRCFINNPILRRSGSRGETRSRPKSIPHDFMATNHKRRSRRIMINDEFFIRPKCFKECFKSLEESPFD